MKIKRLDYRDIDIKRIIFASSSHPRTTREAVYARKPHKPGWTPLTRKNRFFYSSIYLSRLVLRKYGRRGDGVKRAAKSQVARGISASKQVARNEETSFRELEPMEK